jgi:hypothetical protein
LCLEVLGSNDYLLRFCPLHDDRDDRRLFTEPIRWNDDWRQALRCPIPSHRAATRIAADTFVTHVGCSAWNPFVTRPWGPPADRIRIDENVTDTDGHRVAHWLLNILKQGARYFPNRPEMWFPRALLGATGGQDGCLPAATCVKLCGGTEAGKTVLTNMALYAENYAGREAILRHTFDNHYIYVPPQFYNSMPSDLFLQAVSLLGRLENYGDQPAWLPPATRNIPFDLKVVFFRRQKEPKGDAGGRIRGTGIRNPWEYIRHATRSLRPAPSPPPDDADLFTVVFFEAAGETFLRGDLSRNTRLDHHADVIAALVDCTQFQRFRAASPGQAREVEVGSSIPVACHGLTSVRNPDARVCLVVTKTDAIPDGTMKREISGLQRAADAGAGNARQLLAEILREGRDGASRHYELELLRLVEDPDRVHRVFFISTENLGGPGLPQTDGLMGFMRWCLEGAPAEAAQRQVGGLVLRRSG